MSLTRHLHLFAGYGIEMEYMIVDRESLAARPLTDQVLKSLAGSYVNEVDVGELCWSNELVMHVIELKTNGPAADLDKLPSVFLRDLRRINGVLAAHGAMLMPTAMHPFFDPETETKLWPHDVATVYEAYDRIFGCRGHGWSNLQSVHINLPFFDDEEFGALHAAVRLVLPLIPAIAASSPMYEGSLSGFMDSRLEFYRHNQKKIPEITGKVIPEAAYSESEYHKKILQPAFEAIAPHDPGGDLQEEWLNSRGAIARFDRHAIEIRVMDVQETPRADIAIVAAVVSVLRGLVDGRFTQDHALLRSWPVEPLHELFVSAVKEGSDVVFADKDYLRLFGYKGQSCTAGELWRHLYDCLGGVPAYPLRYFHDEMQVLLGRGCLAKRIVAALGKHPKRDDVVGVYRRLCAALADGRLFDG